MIPNCEVIRNDAATFEEISNSNYNKIIIGPGPGSPEDDSYFGISYDVIKKLGVNTPVLGVCLGMQGIAYCFGGKISRAKKIMHGKKSMIENNQSELFKSLPKNFEVMRYHSLIVEDLPSCLEVTCKSIEDQEIMAIQHKEYPIYGVQFHPESFATEFGKEMIENFLAV
jgi:anthranilate synthase component 2